MKINTNNVIEHTVIRLGWINVIVLGWIFGGLIMTIGLYIDKVLIMFAGLIAAFVPTVAGMIYYFLDYCNSDKR